jgi:hypothetical protein
MGLVIAVILAPLLFAVIAFYAVVQLTLLLARLIFAPVVWLSNRPPRQRIELRHYD